MLNRNEAQTGASSTSINVDENYIDLSVDVDSDLEDFLDGEVDSEDPGGDEQEEQTDDDFARVVEEGLKVLLRLPEYCSFGNHFNFQLKLPGLSKILNS